MTALARRGRKVALWKRGAEPACDALIFSKIYDGTAYEAAQDVRARGIRVVLDLCDNHWFGEENHPPVAARARQLARMLGGVDFVTSSTSLLAEQIADRFSWPQEKTRVVPDPVLPAQPVAPSLKAWWDLLRLRRHLASYPDASHLVWFGNHGAGHVRSGMEDLDRIRSIIDGRDSPFTLTVQSNSPAKFRKLFRDWQLPTHYIPWRLDTADRVLEMHDAAVIPITLNAFTAAKTMNRPATALMSGLEVFADRIPSYGELAPFITLDDWPLLRERPPKCAVSGARNQAAQEYLLAHYSAERVGEAWSEAVDQALR